MIKTTLNTLSVSLTEATELGSLAHIISPLMTEQVAGLLFRREICLKVISHGSKVANGANICEALIAETGADEHTMLLGVTAAIEEYERLGTMQQQHSLQGMRA